MKGSSSTDSCASSLDIPISTGLSKHRLTFTGIPENPQPAVLQAAVSVLLDDQPSDDVYPGLSPHDSNSKPWSCWWEPTITGGVLEIGLAHQLLRERLARRLSESNGIRLGGSSLVLERASLESKDTVLNWNELESLTPSKHLTVGFLTPSTLRSGKNTTPWMAPSSILSSLTTRLNGLFPQPVLPSPSPQERASLWVSDLRGKTQRLPLPVKNGASSAGPGELLIPGFVGQITYRGNDPAIFARFVELVRMAEYLGIGARTEYGFGKVAIVQPGKKSPRTLGTGRSKQSSRSR